MGQEREQDEVATGDELLLGKEGGVLWVTLNRPAARNALTAEQRSQLGELLEQASADFSVRAVVLTADRLNLLRRDGPEARKGRHRRSQLGGSGPRRR